MIKGGKLAVCSVCEAYKRVGPRMFAAFHKKKKKILSFSKKQQLSENGWKVLFCFLLCPRGEQPLACTVECAAFGLMPSFLRSVCP